MRDISEMEWIRRIRKNDRSVYQEIFRLYYADLTQHALAIMCDKNAAEDIVQDVFLYMLRKRSLEITSIKGYLHISVHHRCQEVLRRDIKGQLKKQQMADHHDTNTQLDADLPKEEMLQMGTRIRQELDSIAGRQREAFVLTFQYKKSYKEAASLMGISLNTFKTNLRLAMHALKKKMIHYKP